MRNYADVHEAYDKGRFHQYEIRKVTGSISTARRFDLSYAGGLPLPNYYASEPLVMALMDGNKGIYKGTTGGQKYVHKICLTSLAGNSINHQMMLCDYVAYVPFVDLDSTDQQDIVWEHELPRYETGEGLRVVAVLQGTGIANTNLTMTYLNQDGVEQTSVTTLETTQTAGSIMTYGLATTSSSYLRMAQGDRGIRKILNVTSNTSTGAICALVLVKPLATVQCIEIGAPNEVDFFIEKASMPKVHDDAYLNFICFNNHTASVTAGMHGYIQFIWEA